jgi:TnpA family transposase
VEEGTPRGEELKKQFSQAHRLSVILNMIVLLCGLFLVGILAFRLRL